MLSLQFRWWFFITQVIIKISIGEVLKTHSNLVDCSLILQKNILGLEWVSTTFSNEEL